MKTPDQIAQERKAVVDEALTWVHTPYHHTGRIKGAGADCVTLLIEVFAKVGVIERFTPDYYPPDFMVHNSDEIYLAGIDKYAHQVESPQIGDIALYRYGRCVSHAGIVIGWPSIVHASKPEGQITVSEGDRGPLAGRLHGFFSLWGDS